MNFNPISTEIIIVATNYLYNSIVDFEQNEYFINKKNIYEIEKITPNIMLTNPLIPKIRTFLIVTILSIIPAFIQNH